MIFFDLSQYLYTKFIYILYLLGVISLFHKCKDIIEIDDKFVKGRLLVPDVIRQELIKRRGPGTVVSKDNINIWK